MEKTSYIAFLRQNIGEDMLLLNAANVVIVNEFNEVLLQQRTGSNLWGLPGGLMELNESIAEAAIRETYEEMGVIVELTGFLGIFTNPMMRWRENDKARVLCYSFTAKIIEGTVHVHDEESVAFGYFSKDNLPPIHAIDNYQAIEAYYQGKRNVIEGRIYQ
jgi:ADP-ribose pyrophosphatase YjhB (NUDIX family)